MYIYHRFYWTTIALLVWHLSTNPARVKGISRTSDQLQNDAKTTESSVEIEPVKNSLKMLKENQNKFQRAVSPALMYQQSSTALCEPFVVGDEKAQIIYSPGYPNNYPNNTACVRIIEAPIDFIVRLDFRDYFAIEPSDDCKFDFLEIRDGAHGFSNKLGQFCGNEFPPIITSKDRHLWLHFKSDENIEYQGFMAVYEFIERPSPWGSEQESCRMDMGGNEGFINRTDIPVSINQTAFQHGLPLDCMWTIVVEQGWKIQLAFEKFSLKKPNDCDSNFIDIFDGKTDIPSRKKNFCGSVAGE